MNMDKKLFLVIFCLVFTIYVFTSDGHRSTSDEAFLQQQALRIVLQEPDPAFVHGESGNLFKYPEFHYPYGQGPICNYGVLCYPIGIVHSVTAVPFIFVNHHLDFITTESVFFTTDDFQDAHYVFWRNSAEPDHTFMELFYGSFFSSLSVATFFLISRAFKYKITTSLLLAFLLGFTTIFFVYSQTSYNNTPSVFFALVGFLYFKKFLDTPKILYSLISASFLIFGFMVRNDIILIIIPIFVFFIVNTVFSKKNKAIQKFLRITSFTLPLIIGYQFNKIIETMRNMGVESNIISDSSMLISSFGRSSGDPFLSYTNLEGIFGILLSPGAGLFIYVPILLTVFFTFRDFFQIERQLTIFCLTISVAFIMNFGTYSSWEGFTAFSPKYLYTIIPFLLLPLGASLEKRGRKILPIIFGLGILGFIFNFVNVIQDVSWFVWGHPGGLITGLMGLALDTGRSCHLYICPEVTWTFAYSPLINSINSALYNLQPDVFLLKLFGIQYYLPLIISILSIQFYILYKIVKSNVTSIAQNKKNIKKYF